MSGEADAASGEIDDSAPVPRVGARLLIRDPSGAVLLIQEHYLDGNGERAVHWLTPGGGVEVGESLVTAAEREAFEETGLRVRLGSDASAVHRTRRRWNSATTVYEQDDHFFLVPVDAPFDVAPGAPTPEEISSLISTRWWSVAELLATSERILPPDLGSLLHRLDAVATDSE